MAALRFVVVAAVLATALAFPRTTTPTDSRRADLQERQRLAEIECSANTDPHTPTYSLCHTLCKFKSLGALDKDGRYVESGMADLLWMVAGLIRDQADAVAKACNTMNDHVESGCERASQISACVRDETNKLVNSCGVTEVQH